MRHIVNLTLNGFRRNTIFIESEPLFRELLDHVSMLVRPLGEGMVVVDETVRSCLGGCPQGRDAFLSKATGPVKVAAEVRTEFPEMFASQDVVIVSPTLGVISRRGIEQFMGQVEGAGASISASPVSCNANPFWTTMISPLSRVDGSSYRDRNTTFLPKLKPGGAFISQERWEELFGDLDIRGSQWLPEVFRVDGALVHLPPGEDAAGGAAPRFVPIEHEADASLPLLYQLDVVDADPDEQLSFQPHCGMSQ